MSSEFAKKALRLVTFTVATSLSLMFTSALLRIPLSRGLVGLVLIGGLLLAVLYIFAKYLTILWMFSDKLSAFVVGRALKLVASTATQSGEKA
jgi:hypothetical protein